MQAEAERIRAALPKDAIKVIMDERGADPTSTKLAQQINRWSDQGRPIAFIIGGADGIDPGLKAEADFTLRLSSLTLPHAMARVLLLEQIYAAGPFSTTIPIIGLKLWLSILHPSRRADGSF